MPSPQKDRGERKEEQKKKSEEQLLAEQQEKEIQQKLLAKQQVDNSFSKIVDINTPLTMPLLGKDYGTADNNGAINSDLTGESNCCCIIV